MDLSGPQRVEGFNVTRPGSSSFTHSVVPFPSSLRKCRSITSRPSTSPTSTTYGFVDSEVVEHLEADFARLSPSSKSGHHRSASFSHANSEDADMEGSSMVVIPPMVSVPAEGLLHKQLLSREQPAQRFDSPTLPPSPIAGRPLSMSADFLHSPSELAVNLLSACQEKHPVFNSSVVTRAFNIAAGAHEGQTWQDGEAFIIHAVETACILGDLGLDETTVAAGLLHNVLDITMMTPQTLGSLLPSSVTEMVERVSRMSQVSKLHRHHAGGMDEATTRKLRAMLLSMADVRVVLVKLAERVHSMRTLGSLDDAQRLAAAHEALEVFAPLANRLGVWALKAELEDYAFYTLHPAEYAQLKARVAGDAGSSSITGSLDTLKGALNTAGVSTEDLSGRPKNLHGLFQKMCKKGYTMDEIYDVRAVRVIVGSKTDCYAALREVHRLWEPVEGRFKDFIRHSKKNGYQSLHTVVRGDDGLPFEVQIRTAKMHYIAEHGVAAHWRYKEEGTNLFDDSIDEAGASTTSSSPDIVTEAHVAFARWLITWELELADKKCRPTGSPEQDTALSSLQHEVCSFPAHSEHCPFRSLQMGRPAQPSLDHSPIYCVVVYHGENHGESHTELRELPAGTTAAALLESGALGEQHARVGEGKQVLVNHQPVEHSTVLHMGDQVEVVEMPDTSAVELDWELHGDLLEDAAPAYPSAPTLDEQRQRFNQLFYAREGSTPLPTPL